MHQEFKLIIACEAFRGELEFLTKSSNTEILWVQHSLHNFPKQLNMKIKEKIEEAEKKLKSGETVLLFFGNCGGAVEGIQSKTLNLVYPDVDDCIPILLGSMERFRHLQKERPGTFYLNKAWIDSGQDPGGTSISYAETYGDVKGWKVSKKMYKHYTHFALIDNECYDLQNYRKHVMETCEKFEKNFIEEKADLSFFSAILNNQCRMRKIAPTS